MACIVLSICLALSNPLQKNRIGIPCIPLGNDKVLVGIYTDIMAMLENGLVLDHGKQLSLLVGWLSAAWVRHHFVVTVKNGNKPCVVGEHMVFQCRKTHAGIHHLPIKYRPAHIGTRHLDAGPVLAVEAEHLETGFDPVGAHQDRVIGVAGVQGNAMGLLEIFFAKTIASEFSDEFAFGAVLQNELGTIPVSNINVAIGANAGFRGLELVTIAIGANQFWMPDGQQYPAIQGCLVDLSKLVICDIKELLPTLIVNGQAMATRELMAPAVQQFAGTVVDDDVVFDLVGKQKNPFFPVHHHLMAILDGMACPEVSPVVIHAVFKITVSNDRACILGIVENVKGLRKGHACDQK